MSLWDTETIVLAVSTIRQRRADELLLAMRRRGYDDATALRRLATLARAVEIEKAGGPSNRQDDLTLAEAEGLEAVLPPLIEEERKEKE
jgi:hypothetical protein